MTYEYKNHEIYARVFQTGSALYEIEKDGSITDEVEGCFISHDDPEIVWYEVEAVDPDSGLTTMFDELKTLKEAKDVVDRSSRFLRSEGV